MPPPQEPPLEITLEFSGTREREPAEAFSWQAEKYRVRHKDEDREDDGGLITVPWQEPWLRLALEAMDGARPSSEVLLQLGRFLRKFLQPTHWGSSARQIERALDAQRPVHLTIRSIQADELYSLPWELLPLSTESRFVGMEDCLLQYECLPRPAQALPRRPAGRILFAYAHAGKRVPEKDHAQALRRACELAAFRFDPEQDVLHEANRTSLAEKLREQERPVTVLHLLCHGVQVGEKAYGLMLGSSNPARNSEAFDVDALRDLLAPILRSHPPRLVTLCACQGGDAGTPAHLLGSVARMFHQLGVPAVIASRMPLSFGGSNLLTETLYAELLRPEGNLRSALCAVRKRLREELSNRDWLSLQFYAREGDRAALYPFSEPPLLSTQGTPKRELVLICHEAFKKATVEPEDSDAPGLFQDRKPRLVEINQLRELKNREWKKYLKKEVLKLASDEGPLVREFEKRGTDIIYYGFPYIPLAVLAGYLARNRPVHVLESLSTSPDSARFTWESGPASPHLPLELEDEKRDSGSAARLRISVSALVNLEDCQQVLPEEDVRLDLHFKLEAQKQGSVRREEQLKAYVQRIKDALSQHVLGKGSSIQSIHIFAAIPVSLAFHLGDALTGPATWLPDCFIYNFGKDEQPRYKWRLELRAAAKGKPSVTIF